MHAIEKIEAKRTELQHAQELHREAVTACAQGQMSDEELHKRRAKVKDLNDEIQDLEMAYDLLQEAEHEVGLERARLLEQQQREDALKAIPVKLAERAKHAKAMDKALRTLLKEWELLLETGESEMTLRDALEHAGHPLGKHNLSNNPYSNWQSNFNRQITDYLVNTIKLQGGQSPHWSGLPSARPTSVEQVINDADHRVTSRMPHGEE